MTPANRSDEAVLCDAYAEQAQLYALALERLERAAAGPATADVDALAADLSDLLRKTGAIEDRVAAVRGRWKSLGGKPGPQLQALLDRIADVLPKLIARIDRLHEAFAARQGQLAPEIDLLARGRQMQRTYRRFDR